MVNKAHQSGLADREFISK